ncbi:hypothetical protein Pelo_12500 [Pelomyxa schiedti]|nr:hypothetical protein Pelo_12500 [Pelomyxa schiedti]
MNSIMFIDPVVAVLSKDSGLGIYVCADHNWRLCRGLVPSVTTAAVSMALHAHCNIRAPSERRLDTLRNFDGRRIYLMIKIYSALPFWPASPFFRMTRTRATATVPKRDTDIAPRCTREQDPVTLYDGTVHARTEQRRRDDHAATNTSTFMNSNHNLQHSTHPHHTATLAPIPAQQQQVRGGLDDILVHISLFFVHYKFCCCYNPHNLRTALVITPNAYRTGTNRVSSVTRMSNITH